MHETGDHSRIVGTISTIDGWASRDRSVARFIDNQGFGVRRAMVQAGDSDLDGFGYALRPPKR